MEVLGPNGWSRMPDDADATVAEAAPQPMRLRAFA
jgi:hypothetical protein